MHKNIRINYEILSGSINQIRLITIKVLKPFEELTVSKNIDIAENQKVKNFITKFAAIYTSFVVLAAILLAIIPPFILNIESFNLRLYRALTFLVVSCPCALVI